MSQWTDRVLGHAVWEQMRLLGPALDLALGREGIDATAIQGIERLRSVLAFAGKRLASADPELTHVPPLDGMAASFTSIISELSAFQSDGDFARIINANSYADMILTNVASLPQPFAADDVTALRDSSVRYRETLEQNAGAIQSAFSKVSNKATELESRLSAVQEALAAEATTLASIGTDFQSRYAEAETSRNREFAEKVQAALAQLTSDSTAVQQRLVELAAEITSERVRLTTLGSEFQSQFSTAQESRSKDFGENQTSRQDKFSALMTDFTQRLTDQNAEFTKERESALRQSQADVAELKQKYGDEAGKILADIEQHKLAVEKLVGVIGNLGVTSGYLKAANSARVSTFIWQGITVVSMVVVIGFAYFAFLPLTKGTFSWEGFAGRVVLALAVGVLGAYAAAQSDKYFEMDRRSRKLALELEAIGPYLAPLPPEQQQAFRMQLGERTFGRDDVSLGRRQADKSPATLLDMVAKSKDLRDLLTDLVKAARG